MKKCADWGIDVFVHYSFPRHMAMELIVARHELLKKNADALSIEMVDVTAPDPTAEKPDFLLPSSLSWKMFHSS